MTVKTDIRDRRRATIALSNNPLPELDYVVTLTGRVWNIATGNEAVLSIRYIPDVLVIERSSLGDYLSVISENDWASLEDVTAAILDDFNNELVPRWIHVGVTGPEEKNGGRHSVIVEDRQPNWDNPTLLSRLTLT